MKKLFSLLLVFCCTNQITLSQTLHFEENFDYSTGTLTTLSSDWSESPTGSTPIEVVDGNLTYTDYPSSGVGRKIVLDGGASGRSGVSRGFPSISSDGSSVYASFLLNVTSTTDMDINTSNGDYFANFNGNSIKCRLVVRQGSNSNKYSIGFSKTTTTSSVVWYGTELDVSTIYLIVFSYSFQSGNDLTRFWVNPDLTGSEPAADIEITSGTDATNLDLIQFRQNDLSGDMEIDGLRVSDSWSEAPLPVELTSFTAIIKDKSVILNWKTETEVDNYGFEIERKQQTPPNFPEGEASGIWNKVGFVNGAGNSNSPKSYSFNDTNLDFGKYSYRLKQIDNDGSFEYSKIVEVEVGAMPERYLLEQNYPNPFNPSTTINFSIPEAGIVKLNVYNILGEEVAELINGVKEAGVYNINFDASDLNSGIYIYKLQVNNFVKTFKMMYLK